MAKFDFDVLVYFQEISREDGGSLDLAAVLDRITALPLVERNVTIGPDVVRLEQVFAGRRCRVYDLVKLRMNDYAEKGALAAPTSELPLNADEGIAERTVFAVPQGTNVVAVCRTLYGLRAEGIATYVAHFLDGGATLGTSVIQTSDPMARAENLSSARKLSFKVSRPALEASTASGIVRVREKLASWLAFGGHTITVELGMGAGRRKGELALNEVLDVVRALHRSDAVDSLQLCGIKQSGGPDEIDFLTNRLTEIIRVRSSTERRGLTVRDRAQAVDEAISKNHDYLQGYKNDRHSIMAQH